MRAVGAAMPALKNCAESDVSKARIPALLEQLLQVARRDQARVP
jgi:hypothetical protein